MPHVRHDGTRHPDDPEEVRIEDRSGLFDGALFRAGRRDTEAGVVHEQVDAAFRAQHFCDSSFDRFIAGHVEGQHRERSLARLCSPSAGAVDLIASAREPLCRSFADA